MNTELANAAADVASLTSQLALEISLYLKYRQTTTHTVHLIVFWGSKLLSASSHLWFKHFKPLNYFPIPMDFKNNNIYINLTNIKNLQRALQISVMTCKEKMLADHINEKDLSYRSYTRLIATRKRWYNLKGEDRHELLFTKIKSMLKKQRRTRSASLVSHERDANRNESEFQFTPSWIPPI